MIPTLSQVSSLSAPLAAVVEDYAAGQCRSLEVWLTSVEDYVARNSLDRLRRLLDEHQVTTPVASFQGGLWEIDAARRCAAWELFQRRLELCRTLGVATLVVAGDLSGAPSDAMLRHWERSLVEAADAAGAAGVRLALEFQAKATFANNLQTAAAIVDSLRHPRLGLCLDLFQFYVGPSKTEDLGLVTSQNLFHVQFCDLLDVPRELASDSHRILPGDGDLPLERVVERLRAIGYAGCVSVEVLNPDLWQIPPRQFGEIALTALRRQLSGQK